MSSKHQTGVIAEAVSVEANAPVKPTYATAYTPTSAPYLRLDDPTQQTPNYNPQPWGHQPQPVYINNTSKPDRCRYWGWCCCCMCSVTLIVALLCVYLIPKPPTVDYETGVVLITPTVYMINETYKVTNPNHYSIQFDHLNLSVTYEDQIVGYGTFTGDGSFTVPKEDDREMTITYDLFSSSSAVQRGQISQDCITFGYASYTIEGTMDASFWLADYNNIDMGPWLTEIYCET